MKRLLKILTVFVASLIIYSYSSGHHSHCSCFTEAIMAQSSDTKASPETVGSEQTATSTEDISETGSARQSLPKLVDLGAKKCIPCKKMAPILDEAKKLYEGKAEIIFIDVWENRDAGQRYGIRMIPTQIFYDSEDNEVFRHEGFLPMEDIQTQFESMGVSLPKD